MIDVHRYMSSSAAYTWGEQIYKQLNIEVKGYIGGGGGVGIKMQ